MEPEKLVYCEFCEQEVDAKNHIQVCKSCGGPDHVTGVRHVCARCGRVLLPVYRPFGQRGAFKPVNGLNS